jgi:hypothetical protein
MDIKQCISVLSQEKNKDHIKYFKEQVKIYNYDTTEQLKTLLDNINNNPKEWLTSLPKSAKKVASIRKYKVALCVLLDTKQVIDVLGTEYCVDVRNTINTYFKDNVQDLVNKREKEVHHEINSENADIDQEVCSESNDDVCSELDIDQLYVVEPSLHSINDGSVEPKHDLVNTNNQTSSTKTLQEKYDELVKEHIRVKALHERAEMELTRVWGFVNKLATK